MDTRALLVGAVVAVAVGLATLFLRVRSAGAAEEMPFTPDYANDTVVVSRGWNQEELERILADFRLAYLRRLGTAGEFKTERVSSEEFQILFPHDIAPTLLSFLVNYLQYPRDFDLSTHRIAVLARVKLTPAFPLPSETYVGQTARIYVPSDDQEHDLVYVAVGSEYFKQSFTNMAWKPAKDGRVPDGVRALW